MVFVFLFAFIFSKVSSQKKQKFSFFPILSCLISSAHSHGGKTKPCQKRTSLSSCWVILADPHACSTTLCRWQKLASPSHSLVVLVNPASRMSFVLKTSNNFVFLQHHGVVVLVTTAAAVHAACSCCTLRSKSYIKFFNYSFYFYLHFHTQQLSWYKIHPAFQPCLSFGSLVDFVGVDLSLTGIILVTQFCS